MGRSTDRVRYSHVRVWYRHDCVWPSDMITTEEAMQLYLGDIVYSYHPTFEGYEPMRYVIVGKAFVGGGQLRLRVKRPDTDRIRLVYEEDLKDWYLEQPQTVIKYDWSRFSGSELRHWRDLPGVERGRRNASTKRGRGRGRGR